MLKRKRDVAESPGGGDERPPRVKSYGVQRKRVDEKLFHGKKVLLRALKLAKGFERQKLSRRHKTAVHKNDEADVGRLNAETEALKVVLLVHTQCTDADMLIKYAPLE